MDDNLTYLVTRDNLVDFINARLRQAHPSIPGLVCTGWLYDAAPETRRWIVVTLYYQLKGGDPCTHSFSSAP